jgi:type I restriction enzyme S subunit
VQHGTIDRSASKEGDWNRDQAAPFLIRSGDFLIARGNGSLRLVGTGGLVDDGAPDVAYPDTLIRVRVDGSRCLPTFLRYVWQSSPVRSQIEAAARTTAGIYKVNQEDLRSVNLLLPPIQEQWRIVGAIEEQLSRLDGAERLVASALARLPLIRRAVLDQVMPNPLPTGWKLLTVEEVGAVDLGRQRSPQYHSGPNMKAYLRVANVHEDRIDLSDVKEMDFPTRQLPRYELRAGDILLNEGQSPEFVGRPAMYRGELPGVCFTNSLIRFRPFDFVDGEYALLVFLRHLRFGRFHREAQITTNIAHMAAGRFKKVEFPVPSLDVQRDIVQEVRSQLSLLSAFEFALRVALKRSGTLRAAILAAAFRGELVAQDPSDEPAANLLARISADRPVPVRGNRKKSGF